MRKILFLDIDGVLNSKRYSDTRRPEEGNIDVSRMPLLKRIVDETSAEIVLSSSWRKHWSDDPLQCDEKGEGLNSLFAEYGLTISDRTPVLPNNHFDRPKEIGLWLETHDHEVESYAILDDEKFGWGDLEDRHVKTDMYIGRGLEERHVVAAIDHLNCKRKEACKKSVNKNMNCIEQAKLADFYRRQGRMSLGSTSALKWYKRGVAWGEKSSKCDRDNYVQFYSSQKHDPELEKKGLMYFERAAKCYRRAAELGNDLAMMNYALYLYAFKGEEEASLVWFFKASEAGLAVADYQLSVFYRKGYCGLEIDEERADMYFQRYRTRCDEDERQYVLSQGIYNFYDKGGVLGRADMFGWFDGFNDPEVFDTPRAKPSAWKYGD